MKTKLKLACTGLVTVGLGLAAVGISIPSDTTVTDADVANYLAADIDIAAGATLCFRNLTTAPTFTGSLTGGGNFVVVSATAPDDATAAEKARVTFNGNATGFTGGFIISNHVFTASAPSALGRAKVTYYLRTANTHSYLNGSGSYACPMEVFPCDASGCGLHIPAGVTNTAPVLWRGGRVLGPGAITGLVTLQGNGQFYAGGGLHLAGGVKGTTTGQGTLNSDGATYFVDAPIEKIAALSAIKNVVTFSCDNALNQAQKLHIGANYGNWGTFDLAGHDQRAGWIDDAVGASDVRLDQLALTSSGGPATLTFTAVTTAYEFRGQVKDHLSLCVAGSKAFTLSGTANTTDGALIASNGLLTVSAKANFPSVSKLVAKGTGVLTVNTASVNPRATLDLDDSGALVLGDGIVVEFESVRIDGTALAPGAYTKDSPEVADRLSGAGTLVVLNAAAKTEGATFVWVGGTDGDAIRVAANWQGGVAPQFDGTERLVFGAGTATAVVSGTINAFAIDIVQKDAFTLAAADADAKIVLEQGGLNITNAVDATIVTHVVSCPIELGYLPRTWSVSTNASFNNAAPIIGRLASSPLIIRSWGHTRFNADNSSLVTPLVLTNCSTAGQPWIYNMKGLGSPTRATTIDGCVPRFDTSTAGAHTNEVPLRIRSNLVNTEGDMVNSSGAGSLHLTGKVTYFGAITGELYSRGPVYFHGGLESESGNELTLRITQPSVWIDGQPIRTAGTLATDYGGSWLELAVAGNTWKTLGIKKTTVRCQVANALAPTGTLNIGGGSVYYHTPMGTIDLNGFDQTSARMTMAWNPRDTYNNYDWAGAYALVTSTNGGPAKLTLSGTTKDVMSVKFGGQAGLRYAGTGEMTLTNVVSDSAGTLSVTSGVLRIAAGAGWTNAVEVNVSGTGRLAVAPNAGARAFGPQAGKSESVMRIADSGVVEVAAGESATVMNLILVDGNGKETYVNSGEYGGPDAGLPANHTLSCLAGTGRLRVRLNPFEGTMLILR